jgi:hypothetical protein
MKVYLIPAGPDRFALYSEPTVSASDQAGPADGSTFWGRIRASFRRAVDEGEAANEGGAEIDPSKGRVRRWITRKLAEAVAEQRLLWHLRHQTGATLVHPDAVPPARALEVTRSEFAADHGRHRRWCVIDAAITAITGPLFFFVPGPNIISWYFTFRAVGHFFSMRGAARGLRPGFFTPEASSALSGVAAALRLDPDSRHARVADAAAVLGLEKLPAFVARVADQPGPAR